MLSLLTIALMWYLLHNLYKSKNRTNTPLLLIFKGLAFLLTFLLFFALIFKFLHWEGSYTLSVAHLLVFAIEIVLFIVLFLKGRKLPHPSNIEKDLDEIGK